MEKLAQQAHPPKPPPPVAAEGSLENPALASLPAPWWEPREPRLVFALLGLGLLGLVGWLNLRTGRGLSFEIFYLLGCALVGWMAGARVALLCTVVSGILSCLAERLTAGAFLPGWVFIWNSLLRWLAYGVIAWLAAEVGRLTRGLERTVAQRTARLQQEVEEHKATAELLREAMQLFQQVTENITDVFWVTDPARSRMEYVSPEFERIWGESRQSLYLAPSLWLERIHPQERQRVSQALLSGPASGSYDEEYRVVRTDGTVRWVHERAFPVKDERGGIYRIVGIVEDITERKRTEELLRAQRDVGVALGSISELQAALDSLLEIATHLEGVDCGGAYLLEAESGALHLAAHQGLSGAFLKRIQRYEAGTAETRLAKAGRALYLSEQQIPRSLEVLWGSEGLKALAMVPICYQGNLLGLLSLASYRQEAFVPATRMGIELLASQAAGAIARIKAEEALRRNEAHLRSIVQSAPVALVATDAQGIITFEDGQALGAMGVKAGQHLHRPAAEVYGDFPAMLDNIGRALAGEEFSSVLQLEATVFECRYTPLRQQGQEPSGCMWVATDVTERFRLQQQILEISDREQARIGQDIHDGLCQQLIGLALNANSLQQALQEQQRAEAATAAKLSQLLDEAITESRHVCRGLYPIRLSTQGLVPALQELVDAASQRYAVGCSLEVEGSRLHCGVGTATHLYRIAQEALNNALKHSRAKRVCIRLSNDACGVSLSVQDDGRGMPQGQRGSSGMGLHIMEYRARLIEGQLRLESSPQGTRVCCQLPRLLPTNPTL